MDWRLLFLGYLTFTIGTYLLRRYLAQKFDTRSRLVNTIFFLILYPVGLTVALLAHPNLNIGWLNLAFIILGSAVYPIINLLFYRASKEVDAGHFAILGNLAPIISIVIAVLLLGEVMTWQQVIGAVIILGSAVLATATQVKKSFRISRGVAIALIGIALLGGGTIFEFLMLGRMDFGAYLIYGWGAQVFWMVVIAWKDLRHIKLLKDKSFAVPTLTYAFANAIKSVFFVGALFAVTSASTISAALGIVPVLVVIAAYFFLKERSHFVQRIIAGVLGLVGLIIIYAS